MTTAACQAAQSQACRQSPRRAGQASLSRAPPPTRAMKNRCVATTRVPPRAFHWQVLFQVSTQLTPLRLFVPLCKTHDSWTVLPCAQAARMRMPSHTGAAAKRHVLVAPGVACGVSCRSSVWRCACRACSLRGRARKLPTAVPCSTCVRVCTHCCVTCCTRSCARTRSRHHPESMARRDNTDARHRQHVRTPTPCASQPV